MGVVGGVGGVGGVVAGLSPWFGRDSVMAGCLVSLDYLCIW